MKLRLTKKALKAARGDRYTPLLTKVTVYDLFRLPEKYRKIIR